MRWLLHVFVSGALAALTSASAVRIPERHLLEKRAPAPSCSSKDVQVVVKILSALKASPFCSEFLGIKTSTSIVTSTATSVGTTTVTSTSSVQVLVTATSNTVVAIADPTTVANTVTVTPPAVTVTSTKTDQATTTVTVSSTSTSTICTGRGVVKRDVLPTSANLQTRFNIPKELRVYAEALIKTACGCYVAAPTVTRTATVTATATTTSTATTAVVPTTTYVPTTETVDISTTLAPLLVTTTVTTTRTVTSTSTAVVPTTTNVSKDYTQVFSGSGCVYNRYTDFYVLAAPNFADAEQQCACNCNKNPSCKSFFIYYSPPSGRFGEEYDCTNDNVPYDSGFTQCGVSFAAQGKAYNKIGV